MIASQDQDVQSIQVIPPIHLTGSMPSIALMSLDGFLASLDTSDKTRTIYLKAVRAYQGWLQATGRAGIRQDIIEYRDGLKADHKPTTVNLYLAGIRAFYQFLSDSFGIPDLAASVKGCKIHGNAHRRDALTIDQAKGVLTSMQADQSIEGLRNYAMVNLFIRTGIRAFQLTALNVGSIRNKGNQTILIIPTKAYDDDSFVLLEYEALEPIQRYLAARSSKYGRLAADDPLFASESNRHLHGRLSTAMVSKIGKDAMRAVGIDSDTLTGCHSFRHTAADAALIGNASLRAVQSLLGHSSIDTTLIYVSEMERLGPDAAEKAITRALS